MKKTLILILICSPFITKALPWEQKANYPGGGRTKTFSFSIGNKGYVGCGFKGGSGSNQDFWEFDPSTNIWTQKANFPGGPRWMAIGFSIGNKGYAGLGTFPNNTMFQDFWEYDPATDTWSQKANFGGGNRYEALGFSIGSMGYVGTGYDGLGGGFNDLWQYNPVANSWIQKASVPMFPPNIGGASAFVIGNNGYIVGGIAGISYLYSLWEYNSIIDTFIQKANFPPNARAFSAAFSLCDKGYFGTGEIPASGSANDLWQYDPIANAWNQKASLPSFSRYDAAYFSIGDKGYIGLGTQTGEYNDFWQYTPDTLCITGTNEILDATLISNFPSPFSSQLTFTLSNNEQATITLYDMLSRQVLQQTFTGSATLNTTQMQGGIYFYELRDDKGTIKKGKVIRQ